MTPSAVEIRGIFMDFLQEMIAPSMERIVANPTTVHQLISYLDNLLHGLPLTDNQPSDPYKIPREFLL